MRPDDLALLAVPSSLALHGDLVLTAVSRPDPRANRYRSSLWRIPVDGGPARRWTWGERDSQPVISPDGRWVAFLRAAEGTGPQSHPQLHVIPADGGDARRITDLPLGVSRPVWAPDSRRVAFTARIPEPGRYGTPAEVGTEAPEPDAEAPRRITRLDYRLDDIGFLGDRHARLFVVDALADEPLPRELTDGRCDVVGPAWTPDGEYLLVVGPHELGVVETCRSDLYAVPAGGGELTPLLSGPGEIALPMVTEDGLVLFLGDDSGPDQEIPVASNCGLWALPLRHDGVPAEARRLTDVETVDCDFAHRPVLVGGDVLVSVRHRGAKELRRVPVDAEHATLDELPLVAGAQAAVGGFAAHGGRIAAIVATPDSPGEIVLVDDSGTVTATEFAAPLRAAGLARLSEITATASDGYPVHGFLMLPPGPGPHPVLLCVHGGPFQLHGWGFFDEAQVYASAGYAVVLPNPRGSASYGQAHGKSVIGGYGTVDVDDILALFDAAVARPDLDADRAGVMGGSYGGFMTSWLAAHHGERFRAAWSERACNAFDSFAGSSDIGWEFNDAYGMSDVETQRVTSPLTYADRIGIPFLIAHSEHDWRCPLEQAQRLFVALRRNGVETELLLFPGEGHELTRSGQPRHRVQRFEAVLDWWSRHLKPTGDA